MKTKTFGLILFVVIFLAACAPVTEGVPAKTAASILTATFTPLPPTNVPIQNPTTPTAMELPFNDQNVESVYCQYPAVKLPASEAQGLNDDEIAEKLMGLHLSYFNSHQAPDWCRVDGYQIDKIFYDERTPSLPLEPKGDFMRVVQYSIKLVQLPNMWMSLAGEIDQQNWLHTGAYLAIFRLEDEYTMEFAHP